MEANPDKKERYQQLNMVATCLVKLVDQNEQLY